MKADEVRSQVLMLGSSVTLGGLVWEADFAQLLGCGMRTLRRMRERGQPLPTAVVSGKRVGYPLDQVVRYLNGENNLSGPAKSDHPRTIPTPGTDQAAATSASDKPAMPGADR